MRYIEIRWAFILLGLAFYHQEGKKLKGLVKVELGRVLNLLSKYGTIVDL